MSASPLPPAADQAEAWSASPRHLHGLVPSIDEDLLGRLGCSAPRGPLVARADVQRLLAAGPLTA